MANVNLVSIFTLMFLFVLLFTGLSFQLDEVSNKNTILSTNSQTILLNYQNDVNENIPVSDFSTPVSSGNVSSGGESEDFSREFRESKAVSNQEKSRLEKIFSMPQMMVNSIGIETDDQVSFYLAMFGIFAAFAIGLAIFIAWRSGQVQN